MESNKERGMKHTPGPWVAHPFGDNCYEILAGDTTVCDVPDSPWNPDRVEHDARLIAAAPELLAALKRLVEYCDNHSDYDAIGEADRVIAKAEGRGE